MTKRREKAIAVAVAVVGIATATIERGRKRRKIGNEKRVLEVDGTTIPAKTPTVIVAATTMAVTIAGGGRRRIRWIGTERKGVRENTAKAVTVVADVMITHRHRRNPRIHLTIPMTRKGIESTKRKAEGKRTLVVVERRRKSRNRLRPIERSPKGTTMKTTKTKTTVLQSLENTD
jgi:hypothetical protein